MARGRKMKAGARTTLAKLSGPLSWRYGRDLTDAAQRGQLDPVIGRDGELARLIQILGRKTKNNPVLIGKSGVGRPRLSKGWRCGSPTARCLRACGASAWCRWTWPRCWPGRGSGGSSRSG